MLTFSPVFRRLIREEPLAAPHPMLKDQLTRAPYWFAFKITLEVVLRVMHCWAIWGFVSGRYVEMKGVM